MSTTTSMHDPTMCEYGVFHPTKHTSQPFATIKFLDEGHNEVSLFTKDIAMLDSIVVCTTQARQELARWQEIYANARKGTI